MQSQDNGKSELILGACIFAVLLFAHFPVFVAFLLGGAGGWLVTTGFKKRNKHNRGEQK